MTQTGSEGDSEPSNGKKKYEYFRTRHEWRELLAGIISVCLATFDVWHFGRDAGLTTSLDEILLLTGIALIAGVKNLFGGKQE